MRAAVRIPTGYGHPNKFIPFSKEGKYDVVRDWIACQYENQKTNSTFHQWLFAFLIDLVSYKKYDRAEEIMGISEANKQIEEKIARSKQLDAELSEIF